MKYLKTFEIFRFGINPSSTPITSNYKEIIEVRLQELDDMGYSIMVTQSSSRSYGGYLYLRITITNYNKLLQVNMIIDNLIAMSSELEVEGLNLTDCTVDGPAIEPIHLSELTSLSRGDSLKVDSLYELKDIEVISIISLFFINKN
jgi:hypothetical protein